MANTIKSAQSTESASAKKPAAKKAAPAKKTAAVKKTTVKKPAAKKEAPVKKAVKATAEKKTAPVKKPAVKKETPVKKTAAKTTAKKKTAPVKKPAVKKETPVKKTAVKTTAEKKTASAKKPAAKAAPVKKTAAVKKPSAGTTVKKIAAPKPPAAPKQAAPALKSANLFEAYAQDPVKMTKGRGYIVSASFSANPAYAVYEIVSFFDIKKIYSTAAGLTFVCKGKKLYILVEPASYTDKQTEPANRKEGEKIEKRFSDLEIITAGNQAKIMIAKEPSETFGTFTVTKPSGKNFALALKKLPDVYASLERLLEKSFAEGVPQTDAKTAAAFTIKTVEKVMPV